MPLKKFVPLLWVLFATSLCAGPVAAQLTTIDFETLPDGTPAPLGFKVGESYLDLGVVFFQEGTGLALRNPTFAEEDPPYGVFAGSFTTSYPPGFNIIAELSDPASYVQADVRGGTGASLTMKVFSSSGALLASETSPASDDFWKGRLEIYSPEPFSRVEFWPTPENSGVGIDNFTFGNRDIDVPGLGVAGSAVLGAALGLAAVFLLRRRSF